MTQPTQYGSSGMAQAEGHFATAVSNCDNHASQVDAVGSDLQGHWVGQAATTYNSAVQEWQSHWKTCRQALSDMHQTLQQTHKTYDQTHETTSEQASQTRAAMAGLGGLAGF